MAHWRCGLASAVRRLRWNCSGQGRRKNGGFNGAAPKSRLAIIPGTTHIGMMQRTDWLIPMVTDFLDAGLDSAPPTF